ncbi:MAG TPA: urease accessory protein UreE [Puia sp.]|nr:urease accessory protein UreE [Puia sp.]
MLIQEKLGTIQSFAVGDRVVDPVGVEWHETGKRILRKTTGGGREIVLKFLRESPALAEGDVLYEDGACVVVVEIMPCSVLVIRAASFHAVASVCYEIGNKHLPLYYEEAELLAPYEAPLFRMLVAGGYDVRQEERKLLYPLKTTVAAHAHAGGGGTLFSKILQLTTKPEP